MQNEVWRRQKAHLADFELVTVGEPYFSRRRRGTAAYSTAPTRGSARIQPTAAPTHIATGDQTNNQVVAVRWFNRLRPTPTARARPERTA
jgi:hypothetical protein